MSNQLNIKQEIKAEKNKFKSLPFKQKLTYIKDYYTIHIIAVIIGIIIVIACYHTYQSNNYNTVLYAVLVNNSQVIWVNEEDSYTYRMGHPFEEYLGIDGQKDRVIVDNNYILNYSKDSELSVYSSESLVAMFYNAKLDIHIGDKYSIEYFSKDQDSFFYDLRDIFDEEFLKKHEDKIVTCSYPDGAVIPVAFDISDTRLVKEAELTVSPALIAVFSNTKHLDTAKEYIRFILEEY